MKLPTTVCVILCAKIIEGTPTNILNVIPETARPQKDLHMIIFFFFLKYAIFIKNKCRFPFYYCDSSKYGVTS